LLLHAGPGWTAACVAALAMMTFMPVCVHPSPAGATVPRVQYRGARPVGGAWRSGALARDLMPPAWVTIVLCSIGVYVVCAGLFRTKP
jgi:hypothetical protein